MDYITTKEAASIWGISDRMVLYHCNSGRIDGAIKIGNTWLIPKTATKPQDKRFRRKNHDK
ncbi:helix-turn-helix domain-containing protein [Lysinibacillus pakistanensis]|uniref:Helix-turn-helix domain-containing protein n=1 Tax=Lysinibacillus pakistanensis TaxID=759811 RepID=A0AAX3WT56_9BACI|nr:helix-turn-helix domain-containing protein [Lysinibacillus pakistanensis]MDM5234313.1 helix-turn-helix domain-containing protein [Lysinibacillus pakistanensis]WHY44902.1 helix-turn-helix domain-containing protein [Lysinibacillus pakistanensis]WHY49909.1 helix-turn-helix domain-containing protein [Lysinibacillus pakistanensis]